MNFTAAKDKGTDAAIKIAELPVVGTSICWLLTLIGIVATFLNHDMMGPE